MSRPIQAYALSQGVLPDQKRFWAGWEKRARTARKTVLAEKGKDAEETAVDFSIFTPSKYLLSWATIVGGVEPDETGYRIIPQHSKWVNDNGNAWLNQVLLENYKSFIMAENYLEHVQIPELSKGKILDAVAWVVRNVEPGTREAIPTVFVDILVATNKKKHPKLVEDILKKRINTLSMGCNISDSQCTKCGAIIEDGDEFCVHIDEQLGHSFRVDGKKYIVAELCGVPGKPNSCEFIEASWVGIPAFSSAIRHDGLKVGEAWTGKPLRAFVPSNRLTGAAREL